MTGFQVQFVFAEFMTAMYSIDLCGTRISVAAGKKAVLFFDGNDIVRFSADI